MSVGRNTIYNILGSTGPLALGLFTVPLYLRLIGPDRYGVLSIAWLLLGYFGLFDLGLGRATSYRIAALRDQPPQARADTFWAALCVNSGLGLVGAAALWLAADYFFGHAFKVSERLRPEIMAAVPLLALSVPVATVTGVLAGALQGREKFLQTNSVSAFSTALFQVLPLLLAFLFGPHLVLLLAGALTARFASMAVFWRQCSLELTRGSKRRVVRAEISQLLGFGGWVTMTSMFGPVLFMVDRFVIGALMGARAVAIYSVPLQVTNRTAILPNALTTALFPRMSASTERQQRELAATATQTLASLMSLPILGAIFLIGPFLELWVGPAIGGAAAPLGRVMLVGMWANAFALVPFTTLQASGRPDLVSKALLLEIPFYLVGLYACMHFMGLTGAAIAQVGRNTLDWAVLTWFAGRHFRASVIGLLALNMLALLAGVYFASLWTISDWRWWLAACGCGSFLLVTAWQTLPHETSSWLHDRVRARFPAFR